MVQLIEMDFDALLIQQHVKHFYYQLIQLIDDKLLFDQTEHDLKVYTKHFLEKISFLKLHLDKV
jgi:hypothetical protein